VFDGLGSVVGTVSDSGTVLSTKQYDVYGGVHASSGSSATKHKFVGQLGHTSEDETGLIYMRARYYDPVTGRFVSEDPVKKGINWLAYCNNNPVNLIDRTGKEGTVFETSIMEAVQLFLAFFEGTLNEAIIAFSATISANLRVIQRREMELATKGWRWGPEIEKLIEEWGEHQRTIPYNRYD